jgi:hypothetical protein
MGLATGWVWQQDGSGNRMGLATGWDWQQQISGNGGAADWIGTKFLSKPECLKLTSKKEKEEKSPIIIN